MRAVIGLVGLLVLVVGALAWVLVDLQGDDPPAARSVAAAVAVAPVIRTPAGEREGAVAATSDASRGPTTATQASLPTTVTASDPIALLESVEADLDAGRPIDAARAQALEALALDRALELPWRTGALRFLCEARGREAFPALIALVGTPERAARPAEDEAGGDGAERVSEDPLRELAARALSRGVGPDDGAVLASLVEAGAEDERGALLAALAVVGATTRDEDPARVEAALGARVARDLARLGRGASTGEMRQDAIEALGALGALQELEELAREGDEDDRVAAAIALHARDPRRGAPVIARVREGSGELGRDRLDRALGVALAE